MGWAAEPMRKFLLWALGGVLILAIAAFAGIAVFIAPIGNAYLAKMMCSGVFVAKRDPQAFYMEDIIADNNPLLHMIAFKIDAENQRVRASFFGLQAREAWFRDGLGCTVSYGRTLPSGSVITAPPFRPLPLSPCRAPVHPVPIAFRKASLAANLAA